MLIKLINTILTNVKDKRHLGLKDNFGRIESIANSLIPEYDLKLSHIVDWKNCKNRSLKKQRKGGVINNLEVKRTFRGEYFITMSVSDGSEEWWEEILEHYSYNEWIIDQYNYEDLRGMGFKEYDYDSSILMCHYYGHPIMEKHEAVDFEVLERYYPVHFGYVELNNRKMDNIYNHAHKNLLNQPNRIQTPKTIRVRNALEDIIWENNWFVKIKGAELDGLVSMLMKESKKEIVRIDPCASFYFPADKTA